MRNFFLSVAFNKKDIMKTFFYKEIMGCCSASSLLIMLEKKFGLINSGKTSYSISPMNIQLDILINKFK